MQDELVLERGSKILVIIDKKDLTGRAHGVRGSGNDIALQTSK
jgi:hypothetical protein